MAIFSDMVKRIIEVLMDDSFIIGTLFDDCLSNLALVLQRYDEMNIMLN